MHDTAAGCPDSVPRVTNQDWLGIRYNCEVGPGASNLQTFLGINGHARGWSQIGKGLRASAKLLEKKP